MVDVQNVCCRTFQILHKTRFVSNVLFEMLFGLRRGYRAKKIVGLCTKRSRTRDAPLVEEILTVGALEIPWAVQKILLEILLDVVPGADTLDLLRYFKI